MDRFGRSTGGDSSLLSITISPSIISPPKHVRGGEPGGAAADDHDPVRRAGRGATRRRRRSALLANENPAVALLDPPAVDWVEGRRAQGLACPKVEAGVVPGAAHHFVDDEPLGEGRMIVGASSADREDVGAPAHDQHRLVADMAEALAAVIEFGERNSLREIGAGGPRLIVRHPFLLWLSCTA